MVTSVAPGPGMGFPTYAGGSSSRSTLSNGFGSLDTPAADFECSASQRQVNATQNFGPATHLSGARMHLRLPQRHKDELPLDELSPPPVINGSPGTTHRRSSSVASSRARAQTVSDQTGLRTYPSISSIPLEDEEQERIKRGAEAERGAYDEYDAAQPGFLAPHPTTRFDGRESKRQIITLDTTYNPPQSLGPSLSGLGWEETMDVRPESPLPLPSPMPLHDDRPGSQSVFGQDASSQTIPRGIVSNGERAANGDSGDMKAIAGNAASKTSAFFSVSFGDGLPTPPRPLTETEVQNKTLNFKSSCPTLGGNESDPTGTQSGAARTTIPSRNSIFGDAANASPLPPRNRQRSGLGLGTSPARRTDYPRLTVDSGGSLIDGEPVISEFSSSAARRAALAAAGVNRARSLGESSRPSKSNAIFNASHALPPPPRSPPSSLSIISRPLQEMPSPADSLNVFTVSPSPSPLTATFGDRINAQDRTSSLRSMLLGIPDSRAVTMPFSPTASRPPSSAGSTLPISPVESASSLMDGTDGNAALPLQASPSNLLSPHKRLTREVSNSNCNDRTAQDALPDTITVRPGDLLEPESTGADRESTGSRAWRLERVLGEGAFSRVWSARSLIRNKGKGRETDEGEYQENTRSEVVAIKMMDKRICKDNDRTRISFEREVGVLKRICHPQIVEYKSSFSTKYFNCLVLEQVTGGELFDLLQQRGNHRRMGEDFLRRVFTELCRGVYWLHCANVVHRDLKLENIMFTINPFDLANPSDPNAKIPVDALPPRLVKLTDFGLARFIDPASPRLETRCGSESFAAPEIIMGMPYDGRDTDAWAVGVILFALVTCELPFDRTPSEGNGSAFSHRSAAYRSPETDENSRRKQLMRIARGAYYWPTDKGSEGVKRVVAKLLVRDPARRSRIDRTLWDELWMNGPGSLPAPEAYDASAPPVMEGRRRRVLNGYVMDADMEDGVGV